MKAPIIALIIVSIIMFALLSVIVAKVVMKKKISRCNKRGEHVDGSCICDEGYSGARCEMRVPQTGDRWEVRRDNGAAVTSAYDDPEKTSVLTFDVSINNNGNISMKSRETRTGIAKDDNGVLVYTPTRNPYLNMVLSRANGSAVLFATAHLTNQSQSPSMYARRTGKNAFAGASEMALPDHFWILLKDDMNVEMTRVKTPLEVESVVVVDA